MINVKKRRRIFKNFGWFDLAVNVFLLLFALAIFLPFFSSVMTSFTTEREILAKQFVLIPAEWTLNSYREIFAAQDILNGFANTVVITYFGVIFNMLLTVLAGYAFSKERFPLRKPLYFVFLFTMFFGGGLIPAYLLIKDLGLIDSTLSLILPTGFSIFNMILVKTYFENIPKELREAATIDGAGELTILMRVMLPLCAPIIATICLFYAVDRWNDWFGAMLYINTSYKYPIQLVLRNIVNNAVSKELTDATGGVRVYGEGIKMATVIITMLPIMLVYPFLQRFFMKGIMIGAVKG